MTSQPIDQRTRSEAAGIAMMVQGLRMIHEANGGSDTEVKRCIAGAVGAYLVHVAKKKIDEDSLQWITDLLSLMHASWVRTWVSHDKRLAAAPAPRTMQ